MATSKKMKLDNLPMVVLENDHYRIVALDTEPGVGWHKLAAWISWTVDVDDDASTYVKLVPERKVKNSLGEEVWTTHDDLNDAIQSIVTSMIKDQLEFGEKQKPVSSKKKQTKTTSSGSL